MKDKKYFIFLDVLRFLAFFLVFFYHFLVRIAENGLASSEAVQKIYEHPNYHVATLAVSLFFILSGAGLMLSAEKTWDIKNYFKKRIVRILIPFYLVYAGIWFLMYIWKSGEIFEPGIPKWHFLFTLLGMDGYIQEFGISTFSLGIGEWFLGCLVLIYLLFPLLRKCMMKNSICFMGAATICYFIAVICGNENIPVHMQFMVKLYEFVLGMYWVIQRKHIGKKVQVFSVILFFMFVLNPFELPVENGIKITVLAVLLVLSVSNMEDVLEKHNWLKKGLRSFCRYSFEMYLIHHWTIILITQFAAKWINNSVMLVVLFVLEMTIVCLGGRVVMYIAHVIGFCYNKLLKI